MPSRFFSVRTIARWLPAFAVIFAVSLAPAQDPPTSPPSSPPADATGGTEGDADVAFLSSVLRTPSTDPVTRRGAVERLLRQAAPEAVAAVAEALGSDDEPVVVAVLEALANEPIPDPGLLEASLSALTTATPATRDLLGVLLAKYDEAARPAVTQLALDRSLAIEERLGPIYALAAFPRRETGDHLMTLADPGHGEDATIRAAAFDSLRRWAKLPLGDDFAAWRDWWKDARHQSPGEWARELVRRDRERLAALEREIDALATRYVALLRDHYRSLDVTPGQVERLPRDLTDELPQVRIFAVERIERLMRDSVLIPAPVREKLVLCLDDPEPAVRQQAASLLDDLDEPGLAAAIATRLPTEADPAVAAGYVALLARRPTPESRAVLAERLDDPKLCHDAAAALFALLRLHDASDEEAMRIRWAARDALGRTTSPALLRLVALIGDDEDLSGVEPRLDDPEPAVRAAVAEGFAARGHYAPLLSRASDPAVYPSVLEAMAAAPATLETFHQLVALRPDELHRDRWADAVRRVAGRLDATTILDADRALAAVDIAGPELRTMILAPVAMNPPVGLALDDRVAILVRLTPLLVAQGEALRAYEILDSQTGLETYAEIDEAKFGAALYAGRYDAAATIDATPRAWLDVLGHAVERDGNAARRLHDEINRRFDGTLGEGEQRELETLAARIAAAA